MTESNRVPSSWPSYGGDRVDLWVSEDRLRKLTFRVKSGKCILEFSGHALGTAVHVPFELAELREVLLGTAAFSKSGAATCAIGRWGSQIEICMIAEVGVRCSLPLGRYIAVLGYLNDRLRVEGRRKRRAGVTKR